MPINLWSIAGSTEKDHEQADQERATKEAVSHALKYSAVALAGSATVILGAAKLFPRFNRSLSVSSKTALIVTPCFGVYFLLAEFKMNERKRERAAAAREEQARIRARGY